jgi:hypothetical protein
MSLYSAITGALSSAYESRSVRELLSRLPARKGLTKPGAYQASLTFRKQGAYLIFAWQRPEWVFTSAILFPGGVEGFAPFPDPLEDTLPMRSTRNRVQETLGIPSQSGGGGAPISGVLTNYEWDRFDYPSYSLRLDYHTHENTVRTATLMSRALATELNPSMRTASAGAA